MTYVDETIKIRNKLPMGRYDQPQSLSEMMPTIILKPTSNTKEPRPLYTPFIAT